MGTLWPTTTTTGTTSAITDSGVAVASRDGSTNVKVNATNTAADVCHDLVLLVRAAVVQVLLLSIINQSNML
jgi:hypothetical protein